MAQPGNDDFNVGVILDGENCGFPSRMADMIVNIEAALSLSHMDPRYRVSMQARVYSGHLRMYATTQHTALKNQHFNYLQAPLISRACAGHECNLVTQGDRGLVYNRFRRENDIADSLLIEDLFDRALSGSLPRTILVITSDRDFDDFLRILFDTRCFNIFVAGQGYNECHQYVVAT